jgi:hypothetical protein
MSEPEPPQTADNAVRAFILLFALGFVLRGVDVMDHDMPNAIQKWVIAAVLSIADYFYVPIRKTLGPRFSNTAASVATDFRWWAVALMVIIFGMSLSPYVEQRRWPFAWQIGTVAPAKQATVSTPIELLKPLGGQKVITGAQLVEKVDALQSQLDATKKELENTNAELKTAQKAPDLLSSLSKTILAPQEPTNPLCLNGKCPSLSSPGNILGMPSPDKVEELEATVRKLEEENRRLETERRSVAASRPLSPLPILQKPVSWFSDSQLFIASGGPPNGSQVHGILVMGESTATTAMKEAYLVSGLTGHKLNLKANVHSVGAYFPVDRVDIPAGAPVQLDLIFDPPIPLKDFMDQWGKFRFTVVYADGASYEREYDEAYVRQKMQQVVPEAFGPRMTPRVEK